jgi:hypothetical protein
MLRLRSARDDASVARSFAGFGRWSAPRASPQVLTFAASVWALVAYFAGRG